MLSVIVCCPYTTVYEYFTWMGYSDSEEGVITAGADFSA
jgi:hypothetical protein